MKLTELLRQRKTFRWPSASTSPVPYFWHEGLVSDPFLLMSVRSIFAEGDIALTGIKKGVPLSSYYLLVGEAGDIRTMQQLGSNG